MLGPLLRSAATAMAGAHMATLEHSGARCGACEALRAHILPAMGGDDMTTTRNFLVDQDWASDLFPFLGSVAGYAVQAVPARELHIFHRRLAIITGLAAELRAHVSTGEADARTWFEADKSRVERLRVACGVTTVPAGVQPPVAG